MRLLLFFLVLLCFISCNVNYNIPFHTEDEVFPQQVSLQKSYFVLDSQVVANDIPNNVRIKKVFFLAIKDTKVNGKSNSFFLVLPEKIKIDISEKFNSSLNEVASEIGNKHNLVMNNLVWTNKNLTPNYASVNFDPEIVQLDDLLSFSEINENETLILPLIKFYDNQINEWGWRYINQFVLTVAFYIFDKNQIYYARSANLSKVAYIQNSINPKDTQFLQSEWDYLVYEALRPLLEKGVELEIRSP